MRLLTAVLCWLLTTLALAVAIPAAWAQHDLVDRQGYSALATSAAKDPVLQQAMAGALADQLTTLAVNSGYDDVNPNLIAGAARAYTGGNAFPGQFALANQVAHDWLFTDTVARTDASGRWEIDLSPMLADSSFQQTLAGFGIRPPKTLEIPLTEDVSHSLRPGQLRQVAAWGPWVSVGAAVLAGVFALLTLAAARRRGKALVALGVSGLIVGAAGWAAIEVGRRYLARALDAAATDVRNVAAAMIEHAIGSAHTWLNLVLAAGGGLVVLGVLATTLGGLRRR
ncbi:hypothetical protein MMAD_08200 [Mycolicibacterium madagascariense]|uniref:Uncharacterized protein n=1 Tax=Mycolicibacterium madagascariense TaxID=212765 RepID=A0A7I7XB44_9MYCO|nr:hypothetical protein [Mycolicibacterium madagascariense]MCV7014814.1 hypothetical protein [Mycolicibacterium madagascariense]BBZ26525.1 hypothetical protein MMAD_08200 [Mycolicibacterium madagascariense]